MKVLVIGFEWFYPFTDFVVKGFQQNSCEVDRVDYLYGENQLNFVRKLKQIKCYKYTKKFLKKKISKKLFKINNNVLLNKIRNNNYDLIFVIKGEHIHSETLQQIKNIIKKTTKLAVWHIDDPFFSWSDIKKPITKNESLKALYLFDLVFIYDSYLVDGIKRINKNVHHLPFAVDTDTHKPLNDWENKKYNISFIGCYTPDRYKLLKEISESDLVLFGDDWKDLNKYKKNGVIPVSKTNEIYNLSYMNFNCHHQQTVYGCNTRTFEVPGSGNFLLTDYRKDLENLFEIGKEIEVYNSVSELKEKVNYYLNNKRKIKEISQNGYKCILKKHTYKKRITEILSIMK